ncbi:hypothetical protein Bca4012_083908 [Brassica carinata]|uniref:Uncharacterized protein n=1 Tax=Brassica carinata TaxID=52824 RepID=A0A8X7SK70_BRACI|nr:hypothetical protein Bca52824_026868 [Brassica carinata]
MRPLLMSAFLLRRSLGSERIEHCTQVWGLALIRNDRLWFSYGTVGLALFELLDVSSVEIIELSYRATDPGWCTIDFHMCADGGSEAFARLYRSLVERMSQVFRWLFYRE